MRQIDKRAIRAWHLQRVRAIKSEETLGRIIGQANAWGRQHGKYGPDEIPWDVPGNPYRDELTEAVQERAFCLIRLAQACRRVAKIALGLGQDADPLLAIARSCEKFAWQGGEHQKGTRWARAGRFAETAVDPQTLEAAFEDAQFSRQLDASGIIVDRLAATGKNGPTKTPARKASKRPSQRRDPTGIQVETLRVVGESGSIAAAAVKLGRNPKTVRQNYQAGLTNAGKLAGKLIGKPKTRAIQTDRRGQATIADTDDGPVEKAIRRESDNRG